MSSIDALNNSLAAARAKGSPAEELIDENELAEAYTTAQRPSIGSAPLHTPRGVLASIGQAIADFFAEIFTLGDADTDTFNSGDRRREFGERLAQAHAGDLVTGLTWKEDLATELARQIVIAQKNAGKPVDVSDARDMADDVVEGVEAEATRLAALGDLPRSQRFTDDEARTLRDLPDSALTTQARAFKTKMLQEPAFTNRGLAPPASGVSLRPRPPSRPSGPPPELIAAADAQANAYPAPTAAQLADPHFRDKRGTGRYFKPAGSFTTELAAMSRKRDAANSMLVADNADLWILRYSYTADKPMEVWVQNGPSDGKMRANIITTPSTHDGDAAFQQYARTNRYRYEIEYADGTKVSGEYGIKNPPEYASASDELVIDLNKKGDIVVSAWPIGSAGVYGYREARQLVIHNP